jgi:hypothetical protein
LRPVLLVEATELIAYRAYGTDKWREIQAQ